jgi:hypothetical protein
MSQEHTCPSCGHRFDFDDEIAALKDYGVVLMGVKFPKRRPRDVLLAENLTNAQAQTMAREYTATGHTAYAVHKNDPLFIRAYRPTPERRAS